MKRNTVILRVLGDVSYCSLRFTAFFRQQYPQPVVTCNLAPPARRADHRQGKGSKERLRRKCAKLFRIKIVTCNSFTLNNLHTLLAKPAPVAAFRVAGEGDTHQLKQEPRKIPNLGTRQQRPMQS